LAIGIWICSEQSLINIITIVFADWMNCLWRFFAETPEAAIGEVSFSAIQKFQIH